MKTLIIKYVDFPGLDSEEIEGTKKSFIKTVEEFLDTKGKDACCFVADQSKFDKDNKMVFKVSPLMNVGNFMQHVIELDDIACMNKTMYCGGWKLLDPISRMEVELPIHFDEDLD